MKVKALRDHGNDSGASYFKKKDDVYEVRSERTAKNLIHAGLVEEVKADEKDAASKKDAPAKKAD